MRSTAAGPADALKKSAPRLAQVRGRQWTPIERAGVIAALAIVMGSLFVTTYTLALGDPVPRRIDAALVGDARTDAGTVGAVQGVAENSLDFSRYGSVTSALQAVDRQRVYAALDLTSARPTLYVASAAGASVARLLEKISAVDPRVRVVDTHPLASTDPSGLDIFYLMLVGTIVGFITVFQTRSFAGGLPLRHWTAFVLAFALAASLALTLVAGPILNRLDIPVPEVSSPRSRRASASRSAVPWPPPSAIPSCGRSRWRSWPSFRPSRFCAPSGPSGGRARSAAPRPAMPIWSFHGTRRPDMPRRA